jgi:outer membrane biosynthesis protein TonB
MGSFIPSTSDLEICDNLNKRFSNQSIPGKSLTWLQQLQNHNKNEKLFDGKHTLVRVAYRLAFSVAGAEVPAVRKHRQRWFYLLHKLLPPATDAAIRQVLAAVLDPANNIAYAKFSTRPAPIGLDFELYPQSTGAPYLQFDANGIQYCMLILECKTDTQLPDPTVPENDPPDPNLNVEQPISVQIKHKKRKKKAPKKSAAKKSKKSSAKKSSPKKKKSSPKKKKSSAKKKKAAGKKTAARKARSRR